MYMWYFLKVLVIRVFLILPYYYYYYLLPKKMNTGLLNVIWNICHIISFFNWPEDLNTTTTWLSVNIIKLALTLYIQMFGNICIFGKLMNQIFSFPLAQFWSLTTFVKLPGISEKLHYINMVVLYSLRGIWALGGKFVGRHRSSSKFNLSHPLGGWLKIIPPSSSIVLEGTWAKIKTHSSFSISLLKRWLFFLSQVLITMISV